MAGLKPRPTNNAQRDVAAEAATPYALGMKAGNNGETGSRAPKAFGRNTENDGVARKPRGNGNGVKECPIDRPPRRFDNSCNSRAGPVGGRLGHGSRLS